MPLSFTKYSPSYISANKRSLLASVDFHAEPKREIRERALLSQAISYAQNKSTKLYSLRDNSKQLTGILGFIALSASEVIINDTKKPSVLIDFLFVNSKYRSKTYTQFENVKVSTILIEFAIAKALEASELLGISYLILYPEGGKKNVKLVDFYKSIGFDFMTHKQEWMYLKI